jgi:hypothetical protein
MRMLIREDVFVAFKLLSKDLVEGLREITKTDYLTDLHAENGTPDLPNTRQAS